MSINCIAVQICNMCVLRCGLSGARRAKSYPRFEFHPAELIMHAQGLFECLAYLWRRLQPVAPSHLLLKVAVGAARLRI